MAQVRRVAPGPNLGVVFRLGVKEVTDVLGAEGLACHGPGQSLAEGARSVLLQQRVELLDLAGPGARPAVAAPAGRSGVISVR